MSTIPSVQVSALSADIGFHASKYPRGRLSGSGHLLMQSIPSQAVRLTPSSRHDAAGPERVGCVVPVAGVDYYVGEDVCAVAKLPPVRPIGAAFTQEPAYLALHRGILYDQARFHSAAHHMVVSEYVIGLPISSFRTCYRAVEAQLQGVHEMRAADGGGILSVEIRHVTAIRQPQGALLSALAAGLVRPDVPGVVLDCGGGTLDCLPFTGQRVNWDHAQASPLATHSCIEAVAKELGVDSSSQRILALIDVALRNGSGYVEIAGERLPLERSWSAVDDLLASSMREVVRALGDLAAEIRCVLVTGGGHHFARRGLTKHLPKYEQYLTMDPEPIMGNVRGFQMLAERIARASGGRPQ